MVSWLGHVEHRRVSPPLGNVAVQSRGQSWECLISRRNMGRVRRTPLTTGMSRDKIRIRRLQL